LIREITYKDLQFEQVPVIMHSSQGTKYRRWVDIGMPRIPDFILKHVFYLYKSKEEAIKGSEYGGTGFLVVVHSERKELENHVNHVYGISNWHNVLDRGYSVVRINRIDGKTDILEYEPTEWEWIKNGDDVAAIELPYSIQHNVNYISTKAFVDDAIIAEREIGIGDDVFMIGRFIDHDGGPTNMPAVRFGNIGVMPSIIKQENGHYGESYCIDLHSRTGYSGSPVFVYRTPFSNFDAAFRQGKGLRFDDTFIYLLGIHWGQFPEYWEITNKKKLIESKRPGVVTTDGKHVKGLSGMTLVIPAQRIMDLLNIEKYRTNREKMDAKIEKDFFKKGFPPIAESTKYPSNQENPQHKEDFNSLLAAAVKKKPQVDET
jgi:hypothetical protein